VIPRGEISADLSQEPTDIVKVGDIVKAQVIRIDDDDRTITLSLRAAEGQDVSDVERPPEGAEPKRAAPRKVGPSLSGAQATLGDALKDKLGKFAVAQTPEDEEDSE
jgi:transcriptional accessory protein Tex/SPT6